MKAQVLKSILTCFSIIAILALAFIPVSAVPTAKFFEDGFETGDFSHWGKTGNSSEFTFGPDLDRTDSQRSETSTGPKIFKGAALYGTYNAVLDAGDYGQVIFRDAPLDHAFIRAYVRFINFPAVGKESIFMGFYNDRYIADGLVVNDGGTVKWAIGFFDNGSRYIVKSELEKPSLDTWYCVEVESIANSTTAAEARIYINGHKLTDVSQTGKNSNIPIGMGYIWADLNTEVTRWYDDVVVSTTYIGPNPATPATTGNANSVTTSAATLNGAVNPNGKATTVTFEYGLTASYGTTIAATPGLVNGSTDTAVSAAISGLTPNTTYHFRVVGVNADETLYGVDRIFTTAVAMAVTGPSSVTYGSSTGAITTSGGSGTGALSYSAESSTGCTVDAASGVITVTDVSGTCTVTAMKAKNITYSAQTSAGYAVALNKRAVTLSGSRPYDGSTTANFGILSVSNKVGSDDVTVASGTGTLVDANAGSRAISSFGTLAIGGTAANNYTMTGATGLVTITKANQAALWVSGPSIIPFGTTRIVTTSGGSGSGALSYSTGISTGCRVDAASGVLTVTNVLGTCTVTATKAADINYNAAISAGYVVNLDPIRLFIPSIGR